MYCTNCGKELADNSAFCSACGTKVNNVIKQQDNKTVKLVITRLKKTIGCAISMTVVIDGKEIAKLKNGDSAETEVTVGEHKLVVKTYGESTDRDLVITPELNKVSINLCMQMGFLSGKAAIESVKGE